MAALTGIAALASLGAGLYQGKRAKDEQKRAEEAAEREVPQIDEEEQRRRIAERTAKARARTAGGLASTNRTGPGGLPTPLGTTKGSKMILGG